MATRRHITRVQYQQPSWDRPSGECVCGPVCAPVLSVCDQDAVSVPVCVASPDPARPCAVDTVPEPFGIERTIHGPPNSTDRGRQGDCCACPLAPHTSVGMSTFNEADHPRQGDGRWATKELGEVDPGFENPAVGPTEAGSWSDRVAKIVDTFSDPAPTLAEQLEREHRAAAEGGIDLADPDAPWTWTAMSEEAGDRWLNDLYERSDGHIGAAGALLNNDSREAGLSMTKAQVAAFRKADLMPSDLKSPDRNLRMAACAARGDLVFEGELLSDAFSLDRHATSAAAKTALKGRTMARPRQVLMPNENGDLTPTTWTSLTPEQQLGYIDGYASVMQGRSEPGGALPTGTFIDRGLACNELRSNEEEVWRDPGFRAARHAGVNRAHATCQFQHEVTTGTFPKGAGVYIARGQVGNELEIRDPVISVAAPGSKTQFQGASPATGGTVLFHVDEYLGDVAF